MSFSSINIQGNIISSEILNKMGTEDDYRHQKAADFGLKRTISIRDEIGVAWAAARAHWQAFQLRHQQLDDHETGLSATQSSWVVPLLRELGYDIHTVEAEVVNEKSYPISHRAINLDRFPVHIVGINEKLDKIPENGVRRSPHALAQEYINNTEHLYALATNGRFLRLLRDATRLVRLSYLEFDLEKMMEDELYADFAILYRLLHATRMPQKMDDGESSYIEYYHQESLASGTRIRENLSAAVEQSLQILANGFIKYESNGELREQLLSQRLLPDAYYHQLLRLVYRILFIIVTEERQLVYPRAKDADTQRKRKIYYDYYSLNRLRKLAFKYQFINGQKYDLWESLKTTFRIFEDEQYGGKLGIHPLGSGIFSSNALGILPNLKLDNKAMLSVIGMLTMFENKNKQKVRVNYGDLDVEEFGSVYEGLLELEPSITEINGSPVFSFVAGTGRSSSGSHYTPEELVRPLIKHSLDHIIKERLDHPQKYAKQSVGNLLQQMDSMQEESLLSIRVCDVACGSGHILLNAARRIATELARVRTGEEQPSPEAFRLAIRDVIKNCIYGVDLNPLAVELCKVALWLEAHNPGEPLNFLDHHIKCGNAIVGLAHKDELLKGIPNEAFKKLPSDDKDVVSKLKKANTKYRKEIESGQTKLSFNAKFNHSFQQLLDQMARVNHMPENTPEEISKKERKYKQLRNDGAFTRLKQYADYRVGAFFFPKTEETENLLVLENDYREILGGKLIPAGNVIGKYQALASHKHFFHWFIEFPEVFAQENGGFDCILGNPPFLGGGKISTNYGKNFLAYLLCCFQPIGGQCDLVAYFYRRIFDIINNKGFYSLISTNTISQGDTRRGSLEQIIQKGGTINFAIKSTVWPGKAAVLVTLISITKRTVKSISLDGKIVNYINSFIDNNIEEKKPLALKNNRKKGFLGSGPVGNGFLRKCDEAKEIIKKDESNKNILKPYITGDDLNRSPIQQPSRFAIYFYDWSECEAKKYLACYKIVEKDVKPERLLNKDKRRREIWWQFSRPTTDLYKAINDAKYKKILAQARVSKTHAVCFIDSKYIFSDALVIFNYSTYASFSILQSCFHEEWSWKYSSTMKGDRRYAPSDCFETYPIANMTNSSLERIGEEYYALRKVLMNKQQLGLTKTYNAFHAKEIQKDICISELLSLNKKEIEKQYGKEVWYLWNHLQKNENSCTWDDAVDNIEKLRRLHVEMDNAVLEAYGWHQDSEKWGLAIQLRHDFYEVDYLPENDRVRFTIHPVARKEILKRLLLLNHKRYEEEIYNGLHKKKDVEAFYLQRGTQVPVDITFSDSKKSKAKTKKNTDTTKVANTIQKTLFATENITDMREFGVHEGIYSILDASKIIGRSYNTVRRWFIKLSNAQYEGLDSEGQKDIDQRRISFHGLVELVVIGTLLENDFSLKMIFKARKDLGNKTKKVYPFATNNVRDNLKVAGKTIIFEFADGLVTLDGTGQFNLELIREFFSDIEFNTSGVALRLLPSKGLGKIVVDPKVGGGKPSFKAHDGVMVDTILKFYDGPDSISDLTEDYGVTKDEIEAAIAYTSAYTS